MNFADRARDRNNHFNLIRLTAAFAVLVFHSGVILGVDPVWDPHSHGYDISVGGIAVDAFFVVSGFLVTRSLLSRGSVAKFGVARFLRIFPGLWVMLLLTVFGLGLAMTSLSPQAYVASSMVYEYLFRCGTIITGMRYFLPGVFEGSHPNPGFNISLWTLQLELLLYLLLWFLWAIFLIVPTYRSMAFRIMVMFVAIAAFTDVSTDEMRDQVASVPMRHIYMFFAGSAILVFGDKIPVSIKAIPALLAVLLVSLADRHLAIVAYLLSMPFLILNLAYAPGRMALRFNSFGDFSYGVYIYAYPIQQTLASLKPDLSFGGLTLISAVLTLGIAVLSWRFVEKPFLARKEAFADAMTRYIRAIRPRPSPEMP